MRYLIFLLLLSGCASQPYFARLVCETPKQWAQIWVSSDKDGTLKIEVDEGDCEYMTTPNVRVEGQ